MGSGNAIDIDSQGNIWVFERCGGNNGACPVSDVDPVLQFSQRAICFPASAAACLYGPTVLS